MAYLAAEAPGVGQYNVDQFDHAQRVAGFKYRSPTQSSTKSLKVSSKDQNRRSLNKENLSKTLIAGTFDWIAAQRKPVNKNYFGLTKRFKGAPRSEKKPGPNAYKLNNKWSDSTNVLKKTGSSTTFKSVYYH